MTDEVVWADAFAAAFEAPGSPVEQRVYAAVLGEQHPTELDTYSCLTWDELHRIDAWLGLRPGDRLVDLGCGRGGPGVWLADRSGADLLGLDVTAVPLEAARQRAEAAGVTAAFRVGSFVRSGLEDASAAAVVSIDAVHFATDVDAAFVELARVLRPGGRLAVTAPETVDDLDQAADRPSRLAASAVRAELEVAQAWTPPTWAVTARRIAAAMVDAADEVAAETGADPDEVRAELTRMAGQQWQERRVVLLAARPG